MSAAMHGRRLAGGSGSSGRVRGGTLAGAARLQAARARGVELQLFDLHSDPAEGRDLLAPRVADPGASGASANGAAGAAGSTPGSSHRNETSIAAAMLGHYLAAVRIGRRSIERAYDEKRLNKGGVMVLWFCRQVEHSWSVARWRASHNMMCFGRSEKERRQLSALADSDLPPASGGSAAGKPLGHKAAVKAARRSSRGAMKRAAASDARSDASGT